MTNSKAAKNPLQTMMKRRAADGLPAGGNSQQVDMLLKQYAMLQAELAAKEAQLEAMGQGAGADAATGLANRRALEDEIEKSLSTARRYGRQHALIALEIPDYSAMAGQLGADMAGAMLSHVARLVRQNIRPTDIAARPTEGSTFYIILNELRVLENAEMRAATIDAAVAQTPCIGASRSMHVEVEVGCSLFGADDELEAVLAKADAALAAGRIRAAH